MKNILVSCIVGLATTLGCSTSRTSGNNNSFENCLPKSFRNDLNLFVSSFNEFVNRNYSGQTDIYISSILSENLPNKSYFNESDIEIANRLRANNFSYFIYTEYEEKLNDSDREITLPITADDTLDTSRKRIKVDINKLHLNCLSKTQTKGKLIKKYVALQKNNPSLSPLIVGDLFLKNKSDIDFETKTANKIIAVELYYMI